MADKRALLDQDIQPVSHVEERLDGHFDLEIGVGSTEDAVLEAVDRSGGVDTALVTSRVPLTDAVMDAADFDFIAKFGTGLDNIDLEAARRRGVPVTYTPGVNAIAVAEHAVTLILATCRNLPRVQDTMAAGRWRDEIEPGRQVYGKTIGIVGFGDIGSRVAALLSGFQPTILAHDPYIHDIDTEYTGATRVPLDELLERSDIVSINAELTDETRGMIGARELDRLKGDAVLVNTARGAIVDEDALIEALRAGTIAGAGLDVFAEEPLPTDSPLHALDNVITTPHSSAYTRESRVRVIDALADNIVALLNGGTVPDRFMAVPAAGE